MRARSTCLPGRRMLLKSYSAQTPRALAERLPPGCRWRTVISTTSVYPDNLDQKRAESSESRGWRQEPTAWHLWRKANRPMPVLKMAGVRSRFKKARRRQWICQPTNMDPRFDFPTFRRNPGPIVLAILAVALGVGAHTAIFSVVRSVLLRPLPYLEPDRLVLIGDSNPAAGTFNEGNSSANFLDWRDQNQVFATMAAFAGWVPAALIDGEPEQLMAEHISARFFATLGVRPAIGRNFTEEDDRLGRNDVVILSDGFWERRFGGDPSV